MSAGGKVKDIVEGEAEVESKRGNTIKKNGDEENPAVVIDQGKVCDFFVLHPPRLASWSVMR